MPDDIILIKKLGYGTYGAFGFDFIDIKASAAIQRGEPVIFQPPDYPSKHWIKRVIGLPGDHVKIVSSVLIVNDRKAPTDFLGESGDSYRYQQSLGEHQFDILMKSLRSGFLENRGDGEWQVPEGFIFVVGDNRDNSVDSRSFGSVSLHDIVGTVVKTL